MNNMEYAEVLDYVNSRSSELDNVNVFRVHSSYDPKSNQISKVALKVNYTKDGAPLSTAFNAKGKPTKNFIQRSVQFRGDRCTKEEVITWLDNFMQEKGR